MKIQHLVLSHLSTTFDDPGLGQQPSNDDVLYASHSTRSITQLPPLAVEVHHPCPLSMTSTEPSSGYPGSLFWSSHSLLTSREPPVLEVTPHYQALATQLNNAINTFQLH